MKRATLTQQHVQVAWKFHLCAVVPLWEESVNEEMQAKICEDSSQRLTDSTNRFYCIFMKFRLT